MSTASHARPAVAEVEYPDSDGLPMADNTLQFEWITKIVGNLRAIYVEDLNVFVGGDLLWYPVEGDPKTRTAPDAMVVFGRPKKDYRGSYKQWLESGIAPQVVFEVLSPGNTPSEMVRKRGFYDRFGVEEYYVYDPDNVVLSGWTRGPGGLEAIARPDGWVSPLLGIRFERREGEFWVFRPDGRLFLTYEEHDQESRMFAQLAEKSRGVADVAIAKMFRAQQIAQTAMEWGKAEHQIAETERQRADANEQIAETERQRAERLAAKFRELGIDPES